MKKVLILFIVLLISVVPAHRVLAQNNSGTPYSMYGIGLLKDNYGPYSSLGGVSAAMRDNINLNFLNPASYTALDSNRFYFQFGLDGEYVNISTHKESSNYRVAQNAALNMGLRLFRNLYGSFGFNQRSSTGFDLFYNNRIGGTVSEYYNKHVFGQGGLNDVYFGLGYKLGDLSVGVNTSFLFGNIEKRLTLVPEIANSYYIFSQTKIAVRDVLFDIGLQYSRQVASTSRFTIGGTFNFATKLNADKDYTSYKVSSATQAQEIMDQEELNKGYVDYPFRLTMGVAYDHKDKWLFAGDYTFHNMKKYREFRVSQEFDDYHKGAIGISYLPARYGRYWWQRNRYNIGLYGVRSHLELNDTHVNVLGATIGTQVSVRIRPDDRELLFGIGFDFGIRGTENNGLIREQYAKIRLNVAFKESWFMKNKIN